MGKYWTQSQCSYIRHNGQTKISGWNLAACQEKCNENSKCTAIEFLEDEVDKGCYLRTCKLPPQEPKGSGKISAYYLGPGTLCIHAIIWIRSKSKA